MKLLLFACLLLSQLAQAEDPITSAAYARRAKKEGWTFQYNVDHAKKVGKQWKTGYKKKPFTGAIYSIEGADQKMKSFNLDQFDHVKTETMDQRSCGSCVVFSFTYNFEESLRLRKFTIPSLSQQHLMNCGTGGQCSGAYGEEIAQDLVNLKTLHTLADYPYTASSGSCKTKTGPRYGQIVGYKSIEPSVQNILAALHNGQPVSVGIAASGAWGSYSGGVYNACDSMGVNHYVVIVGVDCETSVDKDGYCVFDQNGNLPPGVGTFWVQNSWGNSYGVKGRITQKITTKSGKRCNAIASEKGDAQVLDIGVPMPEEKPETFVVENASVKLTVTVQPNQQYRSEDAKKALERAINTLGR